MKKVILFCLATFCFLLVLLKPSDKEIQLEFHKALVANNYDAIESYDNAENLKIHDYMFFSTLEFKNQNVGYALLSKVSISNVN